MPQCKATTKSGHRCQQVVSGGEGYCHSHQDEWDLPRLGSTIAGAATGLRIGGPVGGLLGALAGYAAPDLWRKKEKTKAFVSFDFDNDRALRDFLVGQAHNPDSPFEVIDHSLKEAAPERNWLEKARHAITVSDVVVIMLGPKTRCAQGVLKEVQIASELNKRRFQIIGYAHGSENWKIPNGGRVYRWNWENLKKLFG